MSDATISQKVVDAVRYQVFALQIRLDGTQYKLRLMPSYHR